VVIRALFDVRFVTRQKRQLGVRGEMASGVPLVIADGYHRIWAVRYFDESAPIPCRIVRLGV
jgi:hypothetical protein